MFPSFLCSQKPDCYLMIPFSLQALKSWLFSPITLEPLGLKTKLVSSLLLIATFCAFSFLLPKHPRSESPVIRLYHHYPFFVTAFSSMATSLHFMMNVIFWFILILNTAPFWLTSIYLWIILPNRWVS